MCSYIICSIYLWGVPKYISSKIYGIRVTPGFTKNIFYQLYIIPFLFHYWRFCIVIEIVAALIPLYVHNRMSMINTGLETVWPLGSYQLLITYLLTKTLYQIFTLEFILDIIFFVWSGPESTTLDKDQKAFVG